jgi:uncharacterized protein YdaT
MNCPKCNHSQQGDIECESCGVVFDRYFNLIAKKKLDEAIQLYNEGKYQVALSGFNVIINAKTYKNKQIDEKCQEYINKIQELIENIQKKDAAISTAETKSDSVAESVADAKGDSDTNETGCFETESVNDDQENIERGYELTDKEQTKICPYCKETILSEAIRCKWCKSNILIPEGTVHVDLSGLYGKYNKYLYIAILFVAILSVFIKALSHKETVVSVNAVPVLAEAQGKICDNFYKFSGIVMAGRQTGTSMTVWMDNIDSLGPPDVASSDMAKEMVRDAYEEPQYSSQELQLAAMTEFTGKQRIKCLASYGNR